MTDQNNIQTNASESVQPTDTQETAASPAQPQAPAQQGNNWMGIAVGALLVIILVLLAVIVGPKVVDYFNSQGQSSQPVAAQPPVEQPNQKPAEAPDDSPPADQPAAPDDSPPAEQPAAPESPEGGDEAGSGSVFPVCSSVGLAGGLLLMGGVFSIKRSKRSWIGR
jgi:uncharacterized protein HemX